jgi:CxxC-x17-CxxC domain-containing protein
VKKNSKSKSKIPPAPKVDPYLEGFMTKLLERLAGLEKKMDALIAQSAGKPPAGNPPFQNSQVLTPPRRDRVYYEAICADCHKVCEVPFKPSETRAVYCKECFAKRKTGSLNKPSFVSKPQMPPAKPQIKPSVLEKPAKKSSSIKKAKKKNK